MHAENLTCGHICTVRKDKLPPGIIQQDYNVTDTSRWCIDNMQPALLKTVNLHLSLAS